MKQKKLARLLDLKRKFFDTVAADVDYKTSDESIFSTRFLNLLRSKMPCAKDFLAANMTQRREYAQEINDLLIVETDWKALISKSKHENNIVKKLFSEEAAKFESEISNIFHPPVGTTHKQKLGKYASEKCRTFCLEILQFLVQKKTPFLALLPKGYLTNNKELLEKACDEVLTDINFGAFFQDIVKISMKKAFDNRIRIESSQTNYYTKGLKDPFLYVKRTDIMYPLQRSLVFYLTLDLIRKLQVLDPNLEFPEEEDIITYLTTFLRENAEELLTNTEKFEKPKTWYRDTFNVAIIFLTCFEQCGIVVSQETLPNKTYKRNQEKTTSIIYWLTHKLENTVPFSHHLPRIVPPNRVDAKKNLVKTIVSNYHKGDLSVSPSKECLDALNLTQKKAFKINTDYLKILDMVHNDPDGSEKFTRRTPFPTEKQLTDSYRTYCDWDSSTSVSALQRYINSKALTFISNISQREKGSYLETRKIAEVSKLESDINQEKYTAWITYAIQKAKRQLLQTSIVIAEFFDGFPIYYGTRIDFRSRMYAWEYLLSRTTGELKQLLCDFAARKITYSGQVSLVTAYYRFSMEGSVLLAQLLENQSESTGSDREKRQGLIRLFNSFNIDNSRDKFDCEDKICYVLSLHVVLSGVLDAQSPDLLVDMFLEIDQVCSGITFMSMLLGIRSLAEKTNLLGGNPVDIYKFTMGHVENFFKKATYIKTSKDENLEEVSISKSFDKGRVLDMLKESRSCAKSVLMRWGFSQGKDKRCALIVDNFKEYYNSDPTQEEFDTIKAFATQYDDFLEELFPNIRRQKQFFLDVLEVRIEAGENIKGVSIQTLDGLNVSYGIEPTAVVNKGYWDPLVNDSRTFKLRIPDKSSHSRKRMKEDYIRGLFPNVIHSIDAAVMRIVITRVWRKTKEKEGVGYVCNQLHDCFLLHPNYVPVLYEVLEELYTDGTFENLADKVFFTPMQDGLSTDARQRIQEIQRDFESCAETINVTKGTFVVQHAYVHEGSVKMNELYRKLQQG